MLTKTPPTSCFIFFLFFLSVQAQASAISVNGKDEDLFERISEAVSKVKSVSGQFTQERRTELLNKPLISKGRFYFEPPHRLLWETTQPSNSGFALEGRDARRWKDDIRFAEPFDVNQDPSIKAFAEQVFTWMRADFQMLKKTNGICVIKKSPAMLKLTPLNKSRQGPLDHLVVTFSHDLSHVVMVELYESNGDFTRISFLNVLINGPVPEKLF